MPMGQLVLCGIRKKNCDVIYRYKVLINEVFRCQLSVRYFVLYVMAFLIEKLGRSQSPPSRYGAPPPNPQSNILTRVVKAPFLY